VSTETEPQTYRDMLTAVHRTLLGGKVKKQTKQKILTTANQHNSSAQTASSVVVQTEWCSLSLKTGISCSGRTASRQMCCKQRSTLSVINLWLNYTVTQKKSTFGLL